MRRLTPVFISALLLLAGLYLTCETALAQEDAFYPPDISGEELTFDTEHFRFHYTLQGIDAVAEVDVNGNGVPDYVEEVSRAMEYIWETEIDRFGWAAPPPDEGFGGNDLYDIYLSDIYGDGTAGYVDGGYGAAVIGDHPHTAAVETRASYSYMVLDNDYAEQGSYNADADEYTAIITPLETLQSAAAHEFLHSIQFGYDGEEPAEWLWEATATWIQDEVYGDINDGNDMLVAVYKSPDSCFIAYGGDERAEDEGHWYGMWIFIRYLSENYEHKIVRSLWEYARDYDGFAILDMALADVGTTFDEVYRNFALALLIQDFEEWESYPLVRLEGEALPGQNLIPNSGVGQMGTDYIEVVADGIVTVQINANELESVLVGINGGQANVFAMPDNEAAVDVGQFEHVYLVIMNLNRVEDEAYCAFAPYTVMTTPGGEPQAAALLLNAPNFSAPEVEMVTSLEEYYGDDSVEPPEELLPAYVPEGYEYYTSYYQSKDEYAEFSGEEFVDWYIPGDGPALVIDYFGLGDDFFSITSSDSPYSSLEDFLSAVNYAPYPGELRTLSGVTALVQDLGDEVDFYTDITFVYDGQFIVVGGTVRVEELVRVAGSILNALTG